MDIISFFQGMMQIKEEIYNSTGDAYVKIIMEAAKVNNETYNGVYI